MNRINPAGLSAPNGYTHVVEVTGGRTLYISGQIAVDAKGNLVGAGDFGAQATQVFENLDVALAAGGATFDDVAKLTIFVTDVSQLEAFREVRNRHFRKVLPASTIVQVVRLVRPELLLEVEAVAVVPASR
jgi:2-iminobutanoate/2-iminopropanoate deaminase